MSTLLTVEDLNVRFGSIHAIKGISFHVDEGEIVSLIGANGAGKTTTLRALSGVVPCTGRLTLRGEDLQLVPASERVLRGLGHSPEGRGVFPQMSVYENLLLGAYRRRDSEVARDLEHCYELFPRLKERQGQMAGTLSGGEQQMLAISRALMTKPRLLLLDEPSLGLAPLIVSQIFEIIRQLNSEGMTILLVEQNARMALKIAHQAYVLETGKITLQGPGQDLLHNDEVRRSYLGI